MGEGNDLSLLIALGTLGSNTILFIEHKLNQKVTIGLMLKIG